MKGVTSAQSRLVAGILTLTCVLPSLLNGQVLPLGAEFQFTSEDDAPAAIAAAATGALVVVWDSDDGDYGGIFGQRFAGDGSALGTEFQMNTYTSGSQRRPKVASSATGDFVVVWESFYQDGDYRGIFGQRFASDGSALGTEFQVNTYTTGNQFSAAVAASATGDFVVVWDSVQDGSSDGIFGQRFASDGSALGTEFQVNTYTTLIQAAPAVAVAADGDFVVVWNSYEQDYGIFGQRYASNGSALGTEFRTNTYTTGQQRPEVAASPTGDFVVVWEDFYGDGSDYGIFGRRYTSDGSALGPQFQVNTYTQGVQFQPAVAAAANGDFVVVWSNLGGYPYGGFGQRFTPHTVAAIVTSPVSGTITAVVGPITNAAPSGFVFIGEQIAITAPSASAATPLIIVFEVHPSIIPAGQDETTVTVFRDGIAIPECTGPPGVASPDPCVSSRTRQANDIIVLTVLTSAASDWNFGVQSGLCATFATNCRTAQKNLLVLKQDPSDHSHDALTWKWIKGQATSQEELGDPTTSTDYTLCIYVGTAETLLAQVKVPAHATKWRPVDSKGYKYKDGAGTASGIQKVVIKGSTEDKAKALVKGKGSGLPQMTLGALPLPITAHLVNSDTSVCLEATYDSGDVIDNHAQQFKAKAQ